MNPSAPHRHIAIACYSNIIGGAEIFLQYLLMELPDSDQITVVGPNPEVLTKIASSRNSIRVEVIDPSVGAARRLLARTKPDLVVVNLPSFTSARPMTIAAALTRTKFILIDHLPTPGLTWRGRSWQRLVTRFSAARVSVGRQSARDAEEFGGLRRGSVAVIYNGVPAPPPSPRPRNQVFTLGTLGRLSPEKSLDTLLSAVAGLPGTRLLIAGTGRLQEVIEAQIESLGISDRVELVGFVDRWQFLQEIDCLVQPSLNEALPLTMLEAMRAGVPVIASDVGSLREAIEHGKTGILAPPGSVAELRRAIVALASDRDLLDSISADALKASRERFSNVVMARQYSALFDRVINGTQAGSSGD